MSEIASKRQLRIAWLRWALVTVPGVLLLGMLSGRLANSGYGNPWFDALHKPMIMPPGWAFGAAWSVLYVLMGLALSLVLAARGAPGRRVAITLFLIQLALNLAWSPVFFAMHRIALALGLIIFIFAWAAATTRAFWRIRRLAGWLMLPYLAWLLFAGILNWNIYEMNPNGVTVIEKPGETKIVIE